VVAVIKRRHFLAGSLAAMYPVGVKERQESHLYVWNAKQQYTTDPQWEWDGEQSGRAIATVDGEEVPRGTCAATGPNGFIEYVATRNGEIQLTEDKTEILKAIRRGFVTVTKVPND
jgi:hypothetical protein